MKARILTAALFCGLLFANAQTGFAADPEAIDLSKLRQEMMQNPGPVIEFMQTNLNPLQEKIQKAGEEGKLRGPEDMKALLAEDAKAIFTKAPDFRKTLTEQNTVSSSTPNWFSLAPPLVSSMKWSPYSTTGRPVK